MGKLLCYCPLVLTKASCIVTVIGYLLYTNTNTNTNTNNNNNTNTNNNTNSNSNK